MSTELPALYPLSIDALPPIASNVVNDYHAPPIVTNSPVNYANVKAARAQYKIRKALASVNEVTDDELRASNERKRKVESLHFDGPTPYWADALNQKMDDLCNHVTSVKNELQSRMARDKEELHGQIMEIKGTMARDKEELHGQIMEIKGTMARDKEELHSQIMEIKGTMARDKEELHSQIMEIKGTMARDKEELHGQITEIKGTMARDKDKLQGQITEMNKDMKNGFRMQSNSSIRSAEEEIEPLYSHDGLLPNVFPKNVKQLNNLTHDQIKVLLEFYRLETSGTESEALVGLKKFLGIKTDPFVLHI